MTGSAAAPEMCSVELFGPARLASGVRYIALELEHPISVRELTSMLAGRCPSLMDGILDVGLGTVGAGYILNRNGREFLVGPDPLINPGDSILLLSSAVGG